MNKSFSSVAPAGLKLKQDQVDDGGGRQGNCLELRLGISSVDNGSSSWRVDPWSLAARQEKASLEKAHQGSDDCDLQRENNLSAVAAAASAPLQPVGWPPVRAFRRNLSSAAKPADDAADDAPNSKAMKLGERMPPPAPMFVKVNLEGCAVGRKVDLQAHRGYGSLSRALQSMFHGFLRLSSDGRQWRIAASDNDEDGDEHKPETKKGPSSKTYILLYEDNEGDRMLVGDVPWELFVASVKRLYIAQDTRTR